MVENIRSYKDLHKAIKNLRTRTSSYEDSLFTNVLIVLLKDKEVKEEALLGLFNWKARRVTHFITKQFLAPPLLLRSVKFFYRTIKKDTKKLLLIIVMLIFAFSGLQLKKW